MKKAVSLILVIGVVAALFTLAACGDNTTDDMTSMLDEGATMMSDIGNDLSENLSEALSDESTEESTEDTSGETTEDTTGNNTGDTTDSTNETQNGLMAE
jgi:hypothetical protein